MKKVITTITVMAFLVAFVAPVYALPKPVEKIKDGVTDVVKAPWELGRTAYDEVRDSDNKLIGIIGGMLKGVGYGLKKAGSGVFKIVTFPFDI